MTQQQFIDYLQDSDCDLSRDEEEPYYRIRRRSVAGPNYKTTMKITEPDREMNLPSICLICHHLSIVRPEEAREYYDSFFEPVIIAKHLNKWSEK